MEIAKEIAKKKRPRSGHRKSRESARIVRTVPTVYYSLLSSPIGKIGVAATREGICRISLNEPDEASFRRRIQRDYFSEAVRLDKKFAGLAAGLRSYFSGRTVRSRIRLDIREGTPFQRRVWRALQNIPQGQTQSYRSVAQSIGHPKSSRAVGTACGRNPLPILIPCHRVIKTDGKLGGFTGGQHIKRQLLVIERSDIRL